MQYTGTMIKYRSKGPKTFLFGKADDHIMDWDGCNFRLMSIPGTNPRGYSTLRQAITAARDVFATENDAREYAENNGDATHLSEYAEPDDVQYSDNAIDATVYGKRADDFMASGKAD